MLSKHLLAYMLFQSINNNSLNDSVVKTHLLALA